MRARLEVYCGRSWRNIEILELGEIFVKRRILILLAIYTAIFMPSKNNSALAQTAAGVRAFEQYCVKCHGDPSSAVAAPDELKLRRLTGDEIYAVLGKGTHAKLEGLTENDRLEVALNLGGRKPGVAQITDAKLMKNQCQSKIPLGDISTKSSWTGWGNDPTSNARFQTAKACRPADVAYSA